MQNLTNDQKAVIYNNMLREYQRMQEQIRQIKAEDINLSPSNQRRVDEIELKMKKLYNDTQRLYI
jgi:hypothetical protein